MSFLLATLHLVFSPSTSQCLARGLVFLSTDVFVYPDFIGRFMLFGSRATWSRCVLASNAVCLSSTLYRLSDPNAESTPQLPRHDGSAAASEPITGQQPGCPNQSDSGCCGAVPAHATLSGQCFLTVCDLGSLIKEIYHIYPRTKLPFISFINNRS